MWSIPGLVGWRWPVNLKHRLGFRDEAIGLHVCEGVSFAIETFYTVPREHYESLALQTIRMQPARNVKYNPYLSVKTTWCKSFQKKVSMHFTPTSRSPPKSNTRRTYDVHEDPGPHRHSYPTSHRFPLTSQKHIKQQIGKRESFSRTKQADDVTPHLNDPDTNCSRPECQTSTLLIHRYEWSHSVELKEWDRDSWTWGSRRVKATSWW